MKESRTSLRLLWGGCAVICIGLLSGCTSTIPLVEPVPFNPLIAEELGRQCAEESTILTLVDNKKYETSSFRFGEDSCAWVDARTGLRHTTASTSIRSVAIKNTGGGIGDGLVVGVLGGLVAAVVVGNASQESFAGVVPAFLGPIAGCLLGAATGHTEEYEFQWFHQVPPVPPDSSGSHRDSSMR